MAKINWVGRMLFRVAVLGFLGWISWFQLVESKKNNWEHVSMDNERVQDHNAIYGECRKPIL